jgi:flagellar hook-associated protein 2
MSGISQLSQQQITSLIQAKQKQLSQPINNWKSQIKTDQTELSSWGKVAGAMSSLSTAVDAISDPAGFDDRGVTSSDESIASATTKRGAVEGHYDLTDIELAQSQSVYSESYASGSDSLGTSAGSLTFTFGSGESESVNVDTADMTLDGLAQAINQASGGQVKASLVGGSGGERLVLTGDQTGADGAFTVSGTGGLSQFSYDPSGSANTMTAARAARDASLKVNGVPVSSPTNTLDGVIPDGTVTLAGSGSATLDVNVDASKLSGAVSAVISKLGDAVAEINKETAYKPASDDDSKGKAGPLLGNYSVSSIGNQLLSSLSGLATTGLSGRDIGITVDKDGSVSFDKSQFESAYASNPTATEGLVKQLYTRVHSIADAAVNTVGNGIVDSQKTALNNDIKSLQSQITQQSDFVTMQMQIYAQQFTRLLSSQSSLSVDSDYLSLLNMSGSDS